MKDRRSFLAGVGAAGLVGLAGCSDDSGSGGPSPTFATAHAEGHYNHQALQLLSEKMSSETDGDFDINVVAGGAYGGEGEMTNLLSEGSIKGQASGPIPPFMFADGQYFFTATPFILRDYEHLLAVYESDFYQEGLTQIRNEGNVRLLGQPHYIGPRGFAAQFPIRSAEDISDRNIRYPGLDPWLTIWEEIGVNPTSVPLDEIYSALQQGVAEGTGTNVSQATSYNLNEVTSHYSETAHLVDHGTVWINEEFYQGLDSTYQDLLQELGQSVTEEIASRGQSEYDDELASLSDGGMEIVSDIDTDSFVSAATPAIEGLFESTFAGTWDEIKSY
jgi:TRAP-type C4-dicarboxylate transport system substrate-binding protein